ncbi:FkbM family methyltransferase [Trinickia diaoshuihuensis]|uniref:FkbM family methyltransferase n=1 Tax=Trinickia diaoshuihuensis TaxID=2292265 RepID=UPI0013C36C57|nr:FkbM family methyltransferase [Trinickia diaoshuihuensis]
MNTWKYVPIETLVDEETLARAQAFDLGRYTHETRIRGLDLRWLAPSKRLLWMATGLEYIEPELLDWIDGIPRGAAYYDFGASNGIFALYAAKRGLKVAAIEPDPSNYFLLSWNAFLNRADDVDIAAFNVAASDRFGVDKLFIHKMELGAHEKIVGSPTAVSGENFAPQHVHPIQLVHFDRWREQMGLAEPEYVKIDVDGHEVPVLAGASESLRRCKEIFIEIEEAKLDELAATLRALGFELASRHPVQNYGGLWNCIFSR